jgi:hypothetical protein
VEVDAVLDVQFFVVVMVVLFVLFVVSVVVDVV